MATEKRCLFFRVPERVSIGLGIGYCDFTGGETVCDGDTLYCESPEALRQKGREGLSKWEQENPNSGRLSPSCAC